MISQELYNVATDDFNNFTSIINTIFAKFDSYSEDEQEYFVEIVSRLQDINTDLHKIKTIYENQVEKSRQRRQDYMVIEGDTLPRIANRFFKDSRLWETIFIANQLTDIELTIGDILIIPMVS